MKLLASLQLQWNGLNASKRVVIVLILVAVLLLLLWRVLLAPALHIVGRSEVDHQRLNAQLQQMQTLQVQAGWLQMQPRISREQATRILESLALQKLGPDSQIRINGERVTVALKNVAPKTLNDWLEQARLKAHALPEEARLLRVVPPTKPGPGLPGQPGDAVWEGVMTLILRDQS